jgi:ATP-binding cassette subfamily B protein
VSDPRSPSGWRAGRRLASFRPGYYFGGGLVWVAWFAVPLATGLILKALFDRVSGEQPLDVGAALWLCVALVAVEAVRGGLIWLMLNVWPYWWNSISTLIRTNVLRSILTAPGPASTRLPSSSGEAVSRFRDDVEDLVLMTDIGVDVAASSVFAAAALAIMWSIDPAITLVLVLPLLAAIVATRALSNVIKRWHTEARTLGAEVTAFVGDMFAGVLAVKTSGAEAAALERLRHHNRVRRHAAVRDRLALDMLDTVTGSTVEISTGLVLLVAAPAMSRGEFTVGDLALFTSYVGWLTVFPRLVGRGLYRLRQGGVAAGRLGRLMTADETPDDVFTHRTLWLRSAPPAAPPPLALDEPLHRLDVAGLACRHTDSERGIEGIDLRLEAGSFTVVTGAVGAGKTTLVRALLGLVPRASGTIAWNGQPVEDPGSFLVPPRAAYAGQLPRLFSATLEENLRLGWPAGADDLAAALHLAALDRDVAAMPQGLDTIVGPRGVRLSGGQVQRATAARALIRTPELLVVDDLSSALDVETETLLWSRLADAAGNGHGPNTVLVVSHRKAALERADQVLVLDQGRMVGCGPLDELLATCAEMQRLWAEELVVEAEEELSA